MNIIKLINPFLIQPPGSSALIRTFNFENLKFSLTVSFFFEFAGGLGCVVVSWEVVAGCDFGRPGSLVMVDFW